ncbi:M56 family metallopeptidase [Aequorivita echinoideorum]|uniref:Peptidase M56 domain-containing protein n=1 Tax=Aequorivita echinoideorum TaxID=1549647 RepID=A0ABS5S0H1_9FLAO|nr:M56 family metallopeptidase [Aequorivita echinoideorum]MBT0606701.1 hypothetical protein [Aequorivita echinoideorum]
METISYILKSAAILGFFFFVYRLFLQKETFFKANRFFLMFGLVASLFVPAIVFTRTVYKKALDLSHLNLNELETNTEIPSEITHFDFWQLALLIYILGCVVMFFNFLRKFYTISNFILKNKKIDQAGFRYIHINGLKTPFSFFNYIVFDPGQHSSKELQMILNHEQAHAKQLHSMDMMLMQLMLVAQWFNPFAWLYKKSLEQNLEFLADASASKNSENVKLYQLTLVKAATFAAAPALTHTFYHSFTKKRILMLNKKSSSSLNQLKMLLILPAIAVFLYSFNVRENVTYQTKVSPKITDGVTQDQTDKDGFKTTEISKATAISTSSTASPQKVMTSEKNNSDNNVGGKAFQKIIPNTATKAEIETIAADLKENYDVILKLNSVFYNTSGEIIGINLEVKDLVGNNQNSYSVNQTKGISEIVIFRTEEGQFGITSATNKVVQGNGAITDSDERRAEMQERREEMRREAETRREEMMKNIEQREAEMQKRSDEMRRQMEERRNERRRRRANNTQDSAAKFSLDNALYILDGEEVSEEVVNKLNPEKIESVNILKGKKAQALYKDKAEGKSGVIIITTKVE